MGGVFVGKKPRLQHEPNIQLLIDNVHVRSSMHVQPPENSSRILSLGAFSGVPRPLTRGRP